jgi:hypothetical protein
MKTSVLVTCVLSLCVLTLASTPARAHHGSAVYSDSVTEFKNATVTKVNWANPHVLIDFDAKDAKGAPVHMVVETAAPQALRLIDWQKTTLNAGDVVTVRMFVARNGNPAGRLNKIIMADGTELHDTVLGSDAGTKTRYNPDAGK